jgi:hypothetical protein
VPTSTTTTATPSSTTSTSTSTITTCCTGSCNWIWTGNQWALSVSACGTCGGPSQPLGCACVAPEFPGVPGEEASTPCTPFCSQSECSFRWNGTNWDPFSNNCAECTCSGPPIFVGVTIGQIIDRPCV